MGKWRESFILRPDLAEGGPVCFFLAGTTFRDAGYRIARDENNPIFVLEYIRSGRGTFRCGGERYAPGAGDVYFVQPHVAHEYVSSPSDPWEKLWVNFGGPLAEVLCDAYALRGRYFFPSCPLETEMLALHRALEIPGAAARDEAALALHRMFLVLHRRMLCRSGRRESEEGRRMREFLDANLRRNVPLNELAARIGRSPVQALRIFRRDWGGTPCAYLQKQRFLLARQLLENTGGTIKELAAHLGFKDEFYFSNWFKTRSGVSPSAWRRRFRETEHPTDTPDTEL